LPWARPMYHGRGAAVSPSATGERVGVGESASVRDSVGCIVTFAVLDSLAPGV
jgi:hypothetical protein